MEDHVDMSALLIRYFEGDTTLRENEQIEDWLKADETHLQIARQLNALCLVADTQLAMKKINTEKALRKVKHKTKVSHLSGWGWAQRIAAILSLPLLMGIWGAYRDRQPTDAVAQMVEIKTNAGMTTSVRLPDSTLVYLNSESSLRYPTSFTGKVRQVELNGEAYFDVTHHPEKQFVVVAPDQSKVEVYGTSFNVEAYGKDTPTSTTLIEGSVGFVYKNSRGELRRSMLAPRQKLVYSSQTGEIRCYSTSGESEIAWKDGKLIFNNTSLDEVLHMLGKRFNVEFILSDKGLKDFAFTGTFTHQRLERILEYFRISSHIRWRYIDSADIQTEKLKIEIY